MIANVTSAGNLWRLSPRNQYMPFCILSGRGPLLMTWKGRLTQVAASLGRELHPLNQEVLLLKCRVVISCCKSFRPTLPGVISFGLELSIVCCVSYFVTFLLPLIHLKCIPPPANLTSILASKRLHFSPKTWQSHPSSLWKPSYSSNLGLDKSFT